MGKWVTVTGSPVRIFSDEKVTGGSGTLTESVGMRASEIVK